MTDQHPLHPKLIDALSEYRTCEEAMRASADWQLEHVLKWLKANLMKHVPYEGYAYLFDDCSNAYIKQGALLKDLQKAMRPTTQEDN